MRGFAEAAMRLERAWMERNQDETVHAILNKDYPFTESFDEMVARIVGWLAIPICDEMAQSA
jgi:hypothetical protein